MTEWNKEPTWLREVEALRAGACSCLKCTQDRVSSDPFDSGKGVFFDQRFMRMFTCAKCGNKRCPHATDHSLACTNSNEPGQKGSSYE